MFAARCLSERLWDSTGASEPPCSLHGQNGRKEEVSLGSWLAPSVSHCAVALSRGGVRGSQQTLSIAKQFGERSRDRGSAVIFPADSVVLLGFLSLLCISGCFRVKQSLGVPLLLSRPPLEKGIRTLVLLVI